MRVFKKRNRRLTDDVGKVFTVLGPEAKFVGDLKSTENTRVEGSVVGNGEVRGVLILGATCNWQGNISANVVIIEGKVDGEIIATNKLELMKGAHVTGDITAPAIAMEVGAVCEGRIHMRDEAKLTKFEEQRIQNSEQRIGEGEE